MMKNSFSLLSATLSFFLINSASAQSRNPGQYDFNRKPLKQGVYVQLPLGSIKAKGWLLKQLELQRDGATGHAEELYPEKDALGKETDWLGGDGNSWEKVPYYVKGLVALAYTLDDKTLKERAKKWVDYTLDHQQESGLFGPPKMKDWWPKMPFMYALQSYYEATNDKRVVPFLAKYFRYQLQNIDKNPLDSWAKSRAADNMELALWVYNKTGEPYLLELVAKLKAQAYPWIDIFNKNQFLYYGDDYQPKHMVNVAQALKFPAVYAEISDAEGDAAAMENGIAHIVHDNGQPHGMGAGTEFMSGNSSIQGVETCTVVEWMQSLETASRVIHNSKLGDQLEKIAFNALPAQFSRDFKGHSYYSLPNQVQSTDGTHGFNQDYSTGILSSPYSGFPCCRYNMHMGWPYFVKNSCLATPDGGIAINTYGPMEVTATVANGVLVKLSEDTNYPFEEQIRLSVNPETAVTFPLQFRIPAWCSQPELSVNGKKMTGIKSGTLYTVNRQWSKKDQVLLNFPMQVALEKTVNNGLSVSRGPVIYSLKLDAVETNNKESGLKGFFETEFRPATAWNYGLLLEDKALAGQFEILKQAMPENPFVATATPLQLKVKAKKIPSWTMDYRGTAAFDVPFSPVESSEQTETVTLVPFGSQNIRLSIFPRIGRPVYVDKNYQQNFSNNTAEGWVVYGGGWFYKDNAIHCASNGENSSGQNGPKIIATGTNFSDFVYSADIAVNAPGNAGLIFRVTKPAIGADAYQGYYVGLNPTSQTLEFGKASGDKWTVIKSISKPLNMKQTYKVKVKAKGDQFEVFVDEAAQPLMTAVDGTYKSGNIGLRAYNALATMDNIKINAL